MLRVKLRGTGVDFHMGGSIFGNCQALIGTGTGTQADTGWNDPGPRIPMS